MIPSRLRGLLFFLLLAPLAIAFAWQGQIASFGDDSASYLTLANYFSPSGDPIVSQSSLGASRAALSPGEDFAGIKPAGLLKNFGSRPVYLLASQDDSYSYTSAQKMLPLLPAGESFYYQNAGHGTAMFSNPDLSTRLMAWLGVQIGEPKG